METIHLCNDAIFEKSKTSKNYYGMGTTMVGTLIHEDRTYVFNIGDSRAYAMYGDLVCLTQDHNFMHELVASGSMSMEDALNHPKRNALTNALKATQFGSQFDRIPTSLHGYYKFKAGETFYELDTSAEDKLKPIPDRKDIFNIYAVFYESTEDNPVLDGTNVLAEDNEQIISVAQIEDAHETDEWTEFTLPFQLREGKSIDATKLAEGKYNLTIVFASSIRGDYFEGAPGSTLCIDEVTLNYEE